MTLFLPNIKIAHPAIPAHGSVTAEKAVYEALEFLRKSWGWSGSKVSRILGLSPNTVNHWFLKRRVPLGEPPFTPDMQAVLHLLAIHRSLFAMFSEPLNQLAWLKSEHPQLRAAPLELMQQSVEGLILVRQYLDYIRGRGA